MTILGILTSDWHLSLKSPVARSAEPNWLDAMSRPIQEIVGLAKQHNCPIFIAGDLFHYFNEPAELINWAIEQLNDVLIYTICGQHDLKHHNYEDIEKSAYWTLVKANKIGHIENPFWIKGCRIRVSGFSWGQKIMPPEQRLKGKIYLALIHRYVWKDNKTKFPNAPKDGYADNLAKELKGFDVAAVGDNHIGFNWTSKDLTIFNCGSLIPRNIDQHEYKPMVGLLKEDGTVTPHYLDTTQDEWIEKDNPVLSQIDPEDFQDLAKEFKNLVAQGFSFVEAVEQKIKSNSLSKGVKSVLIELLEEVK